MSRVSIQFWNTSDKHRAMKKATASGVLSCGMGV